MSKPLIIDDNTLRRLLAGQRQDIKKGVCTKEEAMEILGLGKTDFYKEINSPESLVIRSRKQGRFIFSSIKVEFERIHGVPYKEAIYSP